MIDWNKIKEDTEAKQTKFGKYSLADIACFALIEVIDGMFSANTRAAELEAQLAGAAAVVVTMTRERDAFAAENDAVHRAVNEMCGTDTSTIEAVQHVIVQRDELARKLEQAQNEIERLNTFLRTIVNIGDKDHHTAFDGERWRQMRHCANQGLNTKKEMYEP